VFSAPIVVVVVLVVVADLFATSRPRTTTTTRTIRQARVFSPNHPVDHDDQDEDDEGKANSSIVLVIVLVLVLDLFAGRIFSPMSSIRISPLWRWLAKRDGARARARWGFPRWGSTAGYDGELSCW
jgi:hypothetical protein